MKILVPGWRYLGPRLSSVSPLQKPHMTPFFCDRGVYPLVVLLGGFICSYK